MISSERFRTVFNTHRKEKAKLLHDRLNRYDKKKYGTKRRKLRENLNVSEKAVVLAERIKKKISTWEVLQAICTKHCLL